MIQLLILPPPPTTAELVEFIESSVELQIIGKALHERNNELRASLQSFSQTDRDNLKLLAKEYRLSPNEETGNEFLNLIGRDKLSSTKVINLRNSIKKLHEVLVQKGASKEQILEAIQAVDFFFYTKNINSRITESEYDHCMSQMFYYYNLDLQDCFSGTYGIWRDMCILNADLAYMLAGVECGNNCSSSTQQC